MSKNVSYETTGSWTDPPSLLKHNKTPRCSTQMWQLCPWYPSMRITRQLPAGSPSDSGMGVAPRAPAYKVV